MRRRSTIPEAHWTIEAVLESCPGAAQILMRHGMACVGCAMAPFETLTEAAREYRVDLPSLLKELRGIRGSKRPARGGRWASSAQP